MKPSTDNFFSFTTKKLVLTAYLEKDTQPRIEFFYRDSADFEKTLKEKGISHQKLMGIFCDAWKSHPQLGLKDIEQDYLDYFSWVPLENAHGYHVLRVDIAFVEGNSVKFEFLPKPKDDVVTAYNIQKTVPEGPFDYKVHRMVSPYVAHSISERKRLVYRHEKNVNNDYVPAAQDGSIHRTMDIAFVDKVNHSILEDTLFPSSIHMLIGTSSPNEGKEIKAKREAIKKLISDSLPDKMSLKLTASLTEALNTKINKSKSDKYKGMKLYFDTSLFPYMKQSAITFLVLERVVDFLFEDNENVKDQSLYHIAYEWMVEYAINHLCREVNHDAIATHQYQYHLSSEEEKKIISNSYGERFYNQQYVKDIVNRVEDLVVTQDVLLAIPPAQKNNIYFKDEPGAPVITITIGEGGFALSFKKDDFVNLLRKKKIAEATNILLTKEYTIAAPQGDDGSLSMFKDAVDFRKAINSLDEPECLISSGGLTGHAENQLSSILSVEEKISILVSLWIIENHFVANDSVAERNEKIKIFKEKVDKFLDYNCNSEKSAFKRDDLKRIIAFYIAKNKGQRFKNTWESDAALKRLSIEHRKEMIKAIYNNRLPNDNHQNNDDQFTNYIKELEASVTPLRTNGYEYGDQNSGYLIQYYHLVHPLATDFFKDNDRKELVRISNVLMALSNAAFLDSVDLMETDKSSLLKRRECLMELIFHAVVVQATPVAERAYPRNEYVEIGKYYLNTLIPRNVSSTQVYNVENVNKILYKAFMHIDELLLESIQSDNKSSVKKTTKDKSNHMNKKRKEHKIAIENEPAGGEIQSKEGSSFNFGDASSSGDLFTLKTTNEHDSASVTSPQNLPNIDQEKREESSDDASYGSLNDFVTKEFELIKQNDDKMRRAYRSDEIKDLEDKLSVIKSTYFPEDSAGDETSEILVGKTFGREMMGDVSNELENVQQQKEFYCAGSLQQVSLDALINALKNKMNIFNESLMRANAQAGDFTKVKPKFNEYLKSSLLAQHQTALTTYMACKTTIESRGFFARIRSFFGFSTEQKEDQLYASSRHEVKILAMILSVGSEENVTQDKLATLEDFRKLDAKLMEISTKRKALQQKWFPPAKEIALLLEVERKLEEQLAQIALKERVTAIYNTSDPKKNEKLLKTLTDVKPQAVWARVIENVSYVKDALTALFNLGAVKSDCKNKMESMSSSTTPNTSYTHSPMIKMRSVSQSSPELRGQVLGQHNHSSNVATISSTS